MGKNWTISRKIPPVCETCGEVYAARHGTRFCSIFCKIDNAPHPQDKSVCWEWPFSKTTAGYGHFSFNGKYYYVHRVSLERKLGKSLNGLHCCHKCDNPICFNPDHLFAGSPKENTRDMDQKGRRINVPHYGEKHGMCSISDKDILEIRNLFNQGVRQIDFHRKFNVSKSQISRIVRNMTRINSA